MYYYTGMFALLLLILFGFGMAIFATQNTGMVHITVGSYVFTGIPVYVVVLGAMLLGILVSWLIHLVGSLSSFFAWRNKEALLEEDKKTIKELEKKNDALAIELSQLKGEKTVQEEHEEQRDVVVTHPSLFERIRNNFA